MSEYYTTFGPPAIIAIGTIIAAIVKALRRHAANRAKNMGEEGEGRRDAASTFSVILIGFVVALSAMSIAGNIQIFGLSNLVSQVEEEIEQSRRGPPLLTNLPRTPGDIGRDIYSADIEAAAILDGAGPRAWKTAQATIEKAEIFYIPESHFLEITMPNSDSDRAEPRHCRFKAGGKFLVKGFSEDRKAALVQYEAPDGEEGGSKCDTGTTLFYSLPKRVN